MPFNMLSCICYSYITILEFNNFKIHSSSKFSGVQDPCQITELCSDSTGFSLSLLPQNPALSALWKEHIARGLFWVVDYVATSSKWETCLLKTAILLNIKVCYLDMCCGRCSKMLALMTTILCEMQNLNNDGDEIIHTSNLELKINISL